MTWILTFGALAAIIGHTPSLAPRLDQPSTIVLDHGGRVPPLAPHVTVARSYKDETLFARDAAAGTIPPTIGAAIYDPESWTLTPKAQQRHPAIYERRFVRIAKRIGLRAIIAPARDLTRGLVSCPQRALAAAVAYTACNVAGNAAKAFKGSRRAGTYMVPTQAAELVPSLFASTFLTAAVQAHAVHRRIHVIAGLTTGSAKGYATGLQLYRAASRTAAEGYWISLNWHDPVAVADTASFFTLEAGL
jgi:hypothetical protein